MARPVTPSDGPNAHRLAIEAARGRLSAVVDSVQDQPVLLTRRGRPVAALITMEQYEMCLAALTRADTGRGRDQERDPDVLVSEG